MSRRRGAGSDKIVDRARRNLIEALTVLESHPLFLPFSVRTRTSRESLGRTSWSTVSIDGVVRCDTRLADPEEWTWVIAHQLCHLGMGHLTGGRRIERDGVIDRRWNAACCVEVDRFLSHLKIGRSPMPIAELPTGDVESLWQRWRDTSPVEADPGLYGVAEHGDLVTTTRNWSGREADWEQYFGDGLRAAVSAAVEVAAGERERLSGRQGPKSGWRRALEWFVASYPLLGGVAAGLRLVEDADRCRVLGVRVAAVDAYQGEIIVNP